MSKMNILEIMKKVGNDLPVLLDCDNQRIEESIKLGAIYPAILLPKYLMVSRVFNYTSIPLNKIFFINSIDPDSGRSYNFYLNDSVYFEILPTELLNEANVKIAKSLRGKLAHSFSIGADPEIFVEKQNGEVFPSFEFLPEKKNPIFYQNATAYNDGYQAECTISPGGCLQLRVDSTRMGLIAINEAAKKADKKSKLSMNTVMEIPQESLQTAKDEHVEFGCMPSFNVYGGEGIKAPGREVPFRSAGGHIHFGIGKQTESKVKDIVTALDAILGVACTSLFQGMETPKRRVMYGLAGEYRLPAHGLEYRTLSNAWLSHPVIMHLVFDLARKALVVGQKGLLGGCWNATQDETIRCIQTCDIELAQKILLRNKKTFCDIVYEMHRGLVKEEEIEAVFNVFMNGVGSIIKNPGDIEGNWNLADLDKYSRSLREWSLAKSEILKGNKV